MTSVESLALQDGELPAALIAEVEQRWQSLLEHCDSEQAQWYQGFANSARRTELLQALACSHTLFEFCVRHPDCLPSLDTAGLLENSIAPVRWRAELSAACARCENADDLAQILRQFRNRHWLRIVWRDLNRLAAMEETVADLSHLAEACVDAVS